MRKLGLLAASVCGAVALVAGTAGAAVTEYKAMMSGDQEVPTQGPPDGKGTAAVTIDDAAGQLCYDLSHEGIGAPTAGHIHKGPAGTAGPVVVNLDFAKNGEEGCVPVDAMTATAIGGDPAGHYVNLHTADYPNGAIRGQLEAK